METSPTREGNLAETGFCEILAELCRGKETGVLRLTGGGAEKSVYLQGGSIVFAASQDPDDRLGELLLTREVIHRKQLEEAALQVGPGKRLGTVLVEMGILPAEDLPRWVREQVKEILFSLFSWTEGLYRFEAGPFPSREAITLRLSTAEIFLSGLRQVQKWSVLRKGAGEIRLPYRLSQEHQEALREVTLGGEEKRLLSLLQSKPTTMEQAALESGMSTLRVYQLFFAFRVLGVVLPYQAPAPVPTAAPRDALVANASDAPRIALPNMPPPAGQLTENIQVAASATVVSAKALADPKPPAPSSSGRGTEELGFEIGQESAKVGTDVGAQTVIFKMPLPQPSAGKNEPAVPSIGEPLASAAPVVPVISDSPPGGKPAKETASKSPSSSGSKVISRPAPAVNKEPAVPSTSEPLESAAPVISDSPPSGKPARETASKGPSSSGSKLISRPAPAVNKEGEVGVESGPIREISPPSPNTGKRGKADFRVVRVEGERLDGNGAQQIEDLLRHWSGKGYRLAGVVPGKKEGIFGSSGSCFFVFEREHHS